MSETLTIAKTWDGVKSTSPDYFVTISISSSTGDVQVNIDAPYFNDPKPPSPPGKIDDLFNYEVVEVFFSSYPSGFVQDTPYLELEVGPHGHYFMSFFFREGDWQTQDNSIELDVPPKIMINKATKRWTCEVLIPPFYLPEPLCGDDLSVSWRVNCFAIHGVDEDRNYLACYPVPGPSPNFHQLSSFQPICLMETMETRTKVDRSLSIANDKSRQQPGGGGGGQTLTDHLRSLVSDQEQNKNTVFQFKSLNEELHQEPLTVNEVALQLRDQILKSPTPSHLLELEEQFQLHLLKDEFVILHDTVWKRRGLSYKKRKLILTNQPRLFYLTTAGVYKGLIPWTMTKRIRIKKVCIVVYYIRFNFFLLF